MTSRLVTVLAVTLWLACVASSASSQVVGQCVSVCAMRLGSCNRAAAERRRVCSEACAMPNQNLVVCKQECNDTHQSARRQCFGAYKDCTPVCFALPTRTPTRTACVPHMEGECSRTPTWTPTASPSP